MFVHKYYGKGLETEDLFQEAYLALFRSVRSFRPELGVRFASYAGKAIRNGIVNAFNAQTAVHIPRKAYSDYLQLRQFAHDFYQENQGLPSFDDLVEVSNLSHNRVSTLINAGMAPVSLDNFIINDGEEISAAEILPDPHSINPEKLITNSCFQDDVERALSSVSEKEAFVLRGRFGLWDGSTKSQNELAESMGVTRAYVSLLEKQGINKIRKSPRIADLKDYLKD
jgi:RNA polymerase primary sigma factor